LDWEEVMSSLGIRPPFGLPRRRHLSGRGSKHVSRHERRSSYFDVNTCPQCPVWVGTYL
jgi:hypothetical protein